MLKRLQSLTVSKAAVVAVLLLVAIMPWFRGGKDPVGWMVLLGVAVLGSFVAWRSPDNQVKLGRLGWAWTALIGWTALSLLWTVNRFQTFSWLLLWILVGSVFVVASTVRRRPEVREVFVNGYLWVAALASLYGIVLFIFETYDRATSTFYLANPFAGFLLAAVIIGLWRFAEHNRLWEGLVTMISLSAFILADSRGAGLVLVVILFLSLWLSRQLFKHWRRIVIVLVGALALTLIFNLARAHISHHFSFQGARLAEVLEGQSNSASDRIYYLRSAIAMWAERPLAGWGAGTYGTVHPQFQYRVTSASRDAHNLFVQTLGELGVIGFAVMVWLMLEILLGLWRGVKHDQNLVPLALGALALLLHFGLDIDASYPVLLALAAVLIALSHLPKAKSQAGSGSMTIVSLGLALSLVLAMPVIAVFRGLVNAAAADSWQSLDDYEKALSYYQRAHGGLVYDPDWLTAEGINRYTLASLGLERTKNLELASWNAATAMRQDPRDGQHYYLLGQVKALQGQTDQAQKQYQAAIRLDPFDNPQYYNSLAVLYLKEKKLNLADQTASLVTRLYDDAVLANRNFDISLPPKVATSLVIRAEIAKQLGRIDIARSFVADALKIDSQNASAKQLSQQIGQ